jgi:hypothetical protein
MLQPLRALEARFSLRYAVVEQSCKAIFCLQAAGQSPNVSGNRGPRGAYPLLLQPLPPLTEAP